MTILIDMDDTIENLSEAWIDYLNKKYDRSVRREDVTSWDLSEFYPGIPKDDVYSALNDEELWKNVSPLDGAVDGVKSLMDSGHDVYIATSSYYTTIRAKTEEVLIKYFPAIPWNKVIITNNKQMIRGDVLIDDGPHNLIGGDYIKIMPDAPYNRWVDDVRYGIHRVYSWEEIITIINNMEGARVCVGVRRND